MSELTKQTADILGNESASAAELQDAYSYHKAGRAEVEARLQAITSADKSRWGSPPGPERLKAQDDPEALLKLNEEENKLRAEFEVLHSQEKRLREKLDHAKARENIQAAPDEYERLDGELAEVSRLQGELQKALQTVEQRLQSIREKRAHCNRLRIMSYPAANESLMQHYMQAHGYQYSENHLRQGWFAPNGGNPRSLQMVSDVLGLESPGNEQRSRPEEKLRVG